ncbi:MAG: hypothetical protein AABZ31_08110 [Bdellovibrionota bacterium]
MKKILVLCAAALFVTACAKVDGEKRSSPNFVNPNLRPQAVPVNGQANQSVGVTPAAPVAVHKVCVANIVRETTIVEVEKFTRLSPSRFVVREGDTISSRSVSVVKAAKGKKVYSILKADGPEVEFDENYDFNRLDIKSERGTIAFAKDKALTEKLKTDIFSVNEADLTSLTYASDNGDLTPQISEEGIEQRCSVAARGYFSVDEKSKTIRVRIVLTESYYLNKLALKTMIRGTHD